VPSGISSAISFSLRMRSTTRPSRLAVESDSVPDALMSSAGVIIAPRISPAPKKSIAVIRFPPWPS
jgi:hypothetical protein